MLCYLNGATVLLIVLLPLLLFAFVGYYHMKKAIATSPKASPSD
jgi:hypothetical protein